MPLFIPEDYTAKLAPETMEQAIGYLKEIFPDMLSRTLRLAPRHGPVVRPPRARASTTISTAWTRRVVPDPATWRPRLPKWCTPLPNGNV